MVSSSRGAQGLIVVSLVGVVGVAASYAGAVWADSGAFFFVLFGIPIVCAALALVAERASGTTAASASVAVLGVLSLAWSLVTGLGIGLVLLVPSLLLLAAAMISWVDRRNSETPTRS